MSSFNGFTEILGLVLDCCTAVIAVTALVAKQWIVLHVGRITLLHSHHSWPRNGNGWMDRIIMANHLIIF